MAEAVRHAHELDLRECRASAPERYAPDRVGGAVRGGVPGDRSARAGRAPGGPAQRRTLIVIVISSWSVQTMKYLPGFLNVRLYR